MSLVGSPIASRIIARVSTPPAGIPAAPTLDAVAVTLTHTSRQCHTGNFKSYFKSKDWIGLVLYISVE